MNIEQLDQTYIANTYVRFPLLIADGKGSVLKDEDGKSYIDLGTGIAVNTFGASDDIWLEAVTAQLAKIQHTSNLYFTEPCVKLAQMLCEKTGMKKVFFSNSGAEANECAIKAARKYAAGKYGAGRHVIVTLKDSFHGRTITTLAATGQDDFHKDFLPLTPGFVYAQPNDIADIRRLTDNDVTAAILFEAVQGEGGVVALDQAYLSALAEIAKEKDILLIADEVQCGNGRTGMLCGYMNYGIMPDIVTTAKGLGGGLPIGATLLGEKVKDVYSPGSHGSTFGANPACCAGAISILSRIDDALLNEVRAKSEYITTELSGAPGIKSVSGMGLMLGVETVKDASDIVSACIRNGVLVLKAKAKIRLLPALNIPWPLLKEAVGVLKAACASE